MKRSRRFWRKLNNFALTAGLLLGWQSVALAEDAPAGGGGGGGGGAYVLPYAIVILCIFLGVFAVVQPSRRRERAKPDGISGKK